MPKVFLDVGGHKGQTLKVVIDPIYGFDRIYCFEPSSECWNDLSKYLTPAVTICVFGLWSDNRTAYLYSTGSMSASVFPDRFGMDIKKEVSDFVKASDWFKSNLSNDDQVIMKLNCEGCECDILDDLIDSGEISKVKVVMVDFDVRKIASQKHREKELKSRWADIKGTKLLLCEEVMVGKSHTERTKRWLEIAKDNIGG